MVEFTFGMPARGELLFDRDSELQTIVQRLSAIRRHVRNDVVLVGPRRVGKTSLLCGASDRLGPQNVTSIIVDCEGHDLISLLKHYGDLLLDAKLKRTGVVASFLGRVRMGFTPTITALSEAIGRIKAVEGSSSAAGYASFRVEFEQRTKERQLTSDEINDLFDNTFPLAEEIGFPLVIMFDEFQETEAFKLPRGRFLSNFRNAIQRHRNVAYAYTGSAVGLVRKVFGHPRSPLAGSADVLIVGPFDEYTSIRFLQEGSKARPLVIGEQVAREAYMLTGGYPPYLSWLGLRLTERLPKGGEVSVEHVRAFFSEMLSPTSAVYYMLQRQLTPYGYKTRLVLQALARGLRTASQIAGEIPNLSTAAANVYLKRLVAYGTVEAEDGEYRILDPVLAAFLEGTPM